MRDGGRGGDGGGGLKEGGAEGAGAYGACARRSLANGLGDDVRTLWGLRVSEGSKDVVGEAAWMKGLARVELVLV